MKKIILIDNYDSFTFNLYHYLSSLKVNVEVIRNDQITSNEILKKRYHKIVISPGPGNPNQSGNCLKIVKSLYKIIPILGVCLGHQIIGQVFGSKIVQRSWTRCGKSKYVQPRGLGGVLHPSGDEGGWRLGIGNSKSSSEHNSQYKWNR